MVASKPQAVNVIRKLSSKDNGGVAIFVYPGGFHEQLLTIRGKEKAYILNRKGFIKLALEEGCDVVPVYAFGESDLFSHSQIFIKQRMWIQKNFGVAIPLLYGSFGLLPYLSEKGITMVFGDGIGLKRSEDKMGSKVSNEEIDAGHTLYVKKLRELFDKEKTALGYGDRVLEIV